MTDWNTSKVRFYTIDDKYLDYLRQFDDKVPINHQPHGDNSGKRPFVGVLVIKNKNMNYFIPMYSHKQRHDALFNEGDSYMKIGDGRYGIIDFKFMVPVPRKVFFEVAHGVDFKSVEEKKSLDLINQWRWAMSNSNKIVKTAKNVYNSITNGFCSKRFREKAVSFGLLESVAGDYNCGKKYVISDDLSDGVLKDKDLPEPFIGFKSAVTCFDEHGLLTKQDHIFLNVIYDKFISTEKELNGYISPRYAETALFVSQYDSQKEQLTNKSERCKRKCAAFLYSMFNLSKNGLNSDYKGQIPTDTGGSIEVYRGCHPDYAFDNTRSAIYFSTNFEEAAQYAVVGNDRVVNKYKIEVENPLIVPPGFTDWDSARKRWYELFDTELPRKKSIEDERDYWNKLDYLCERRAAEMGYDAIVTETPFTREVAFLGDTRNIKLLQGNVLGNKKVTIQDFER